MRELACYGTEDNGGEVGDEKEVVMNYGTVCLGLDGNRLPELSDSDFRGI